MKKNLIHAKALVQKSEGAQDGVIEAVVGSTNVIDRMGDIIDQAGWVLDNYMNNPVILWGHNVREERPPIGKAIKVWLEGKQNRTKKLMFKVQFDLLDEFAAEIYRKVKDGFLNTVSVGFIPLEWENMESDNPWGGRKYTKSELLELSFVPVPANPEAVVSLRGLETKSLDELFPKVKEEDIATKPEEVGENVLPSDKEDDKKTPTEGSENTPKDANATPAPVGSGDDKPKATSDDDKDEDDDSDVEGEGDENDADDKDEKLETDGGENEDEGDEDEEDDDDKGEGDEKKPAPTTPTNDKPTDAGGTPVKPPEGTVAGEVKPEGGEGEKPVEGSEDKDMSKAVVPFKDMGTVPESESWDGPGEMAKCDMMGLKSICAWYDAENADNKGAYKLPHHKGGEGGDGHKAVWRGVAAAMASLLGARGGVDIPEADRRGVYNHLAKHYKQFDKEAPDFKMVEEQVLAGLDEEVWALTLEREDKHAVRLMKKILREVKGIKEPKKDVKDNKARVPNEAEIQMALKVVELALSQFMKSSTKGGVN